MKKEHPRLEKVKHFFNRHEYLKVFCIIFVIVFLCFAPNSIKNGLSLPMNGDYVLQQLHFYVEGHDAFWSLIKTGEFKMWSYEGFLGVNYYAANTFYYLTSPFSIVLFLVPRNLMAQGIFFMYMIKLTCGGLFFYILLRKYWKLDPKVCLLGGIAYALCGWGMYYLWFNHFGDVLAVFPLTLIGVEHCLQKKQGWLIALAFLIVGMVNYYFFFAFVITSFLYAIFRYFVLFKENKGSNLKVILMGVSYFAIGIALTGFVLIPAYNIISTMGRVEGSTLLLQLMEYFFVNPTKVDGSYVLGSLKSVSEFFSNGNFKGLLNYLFVFDTTYVGGEAISAGQNALYPLVGFLFPSVNNWDTMVFTNAAFDNTISNFYCSMPIILMVVPAALKTFRSKNVWKIIGLIFVIILPFVPITYYLLNAFAMSYGRWQLFMVAAILLFTLPLIDNYQAVPKKDLDISLVVILCLMALVTIYAFSVNKVSFEYGRGILIFVYAAYAVVCYFFLRNKCYGKNGFETIFYFVLVDLLVAGNITCFGQGTTNYWTLYGGRSHYREQQQIINELKADDPTFYRIFDTDSNRSNNNYALTLGYNGLSTFHSVYNFELNDFINSWSHVSYSYYNWSMGVEEKRSNLDTFLNVKYYILNKDDNNIPFGYTLYKEYEYYNVYINNDYVELGYAFDNIIDINDITQYYDYYQIEPYYTKYAMIQHDDMEEITSILGSDVNSTNSTYTQILKSYDVNNNVQYYLKIRGTDTLVPVSSFISADEYLPEERTVGDNTTYYGTDNRDGSVGDQIIVELNGKDNLCSSATTANPCHIIAKLNYGPNLNVAFYNGDTLVTSDSHGVNYYDKSGDFKFGRGYYVDQPITKVVITVLDDTTSTLIEKFGFGLNYEYYTTYQAQMNELKSKAFSDIKVTNNTIHFTTNYDSQQMLVLSVPYDKGWSLKVNGEEAKIYKVDSGFMGIIAPSGEVSYELNYFTPGLSTGIKLSLVGLLGLIIATILFNLKNLGGITKRKKKKKEQEEIIFGLFTLSKEEQAEKKQKKQIKTSK